MAMRGRKARYDLKDAVKRFENYENNPEPYHEIFIEFEITDGEDDYDDPCPACDHMIECEMYRELKKEWKWFYS